MNTKYPGYEQPAVTVDLVIFTVDHNMLKVMLVKRAEDPFTDCWSIPGGFLKSGESLEGAAMRVLKEKAGVENVYVEQLYTFGDPDRDPRARVITVTYFALIPWKHLIQPESNKVADLMWVSVDHLPKLAFDHREIIQYAVQRLRAKAGYSNIAYSLLPRHFSLLNFNKFMRSSSMKTGQEKFQKRMLTAGLLQETGEKTAMGAHRPAMLYKFKKMEIAFLD
jgi:8-oxo-dGTP diphosphatase